MTVKAELSANGRRIYLATTRPLAGLTNAIPGANFNKGKYGPYWSLPLSMPVCRRLREEIGPDLQIGPRLWEWAKLERAKAECMRELAGAKDAELELVPKNAPRLAAAMEARKYQRVGARFIANAAANGAGCLIADHPGLGKTLEALAGVVESDAKGPYLVVTPKTSVMPVWAREIPRWLDGQTVITLPEGDKVERVPTMPDGKLFPVKRKQRERRDAVLDWVLQGSEVYDGQPMVDTMEALDRHSKVLETTWLIVHPEAVRTRVYWVCGVCGQETPRKAGKVELKCKVDGILRYHDPEKRKADRIEHEHEQLFGIEWGAIIVDESDRSLLRLTGTPTQTRQGMELLRLRSENAIRLELTGTPTRGRPHLLWGQLNWIDPKAFPSFWNWAELFWEISSNGFSNHVIGDLKDEPGLWASLDRYVLRRTKAEVAPDLPPKTYVGTPAVAGDEESLHGVWLPMEGAQARAYQDMLDSSAADLDDSRVEAIGILAEMTRLKQFAGAYGRMIPRMVKCKDLEHCLQGPEPHGHEERYFQPALPSNKFEHLVQLLDELGFPDAPTTKIVVASQFTEMLELFARELPARVQALSAKPRSPLNPMMAPVLLTGAQSTRRREEAIAAMNEPVGSGAHLMCLQTKTGGVAITLDQVDHMVILDETYIPDDQEQLEDRIHRVSRPRPVFYHYLRSLDSIDLGIALTNAEREWKTKRLLDGRRGVEYAKAVLRRTREL
jgi:SNF2 family DNA or RNA helicase